MRHGVLTAVAVALAAMLTGCDREPVRTVVLPPPAEPAPAASASASASAPVVAAAPPASAASAPAQDVASAPPTDSAAPPTQAPAIEAGFDGPLGDPEGARLLATRSLQVPVTGVPPARLEDHFNLRRGAGGARGHEAIDIMAPTGTPVVAVDDGQVMKLFTSDAGGFTVYQFDPDGRLAYYYAHLDRYAAGLAEGRKLRRGELIGYVGASGNANPAAPHLHFAIFRLGPERHWWQGEPVNPFPALRRGAMSSVTTG